MMPAPAPEVMLRLCVASALIDQVADDLSAAVADIQFSDPRSIAAFSLIDPAMEAWHLLRVVIARFPAGEAARAVLPELDEDPGPPLSMLI